MDKLFSKHEIEYFRQGSAERKEIANRPSVAVAICPIRGIAGEVFHWSSEERAEDYIKFEWHLIQPNVKKEGDRFKVFWNL